MPAPVHALITTSDATALGIGVAPDTGALDPRLAQRLIELGESVPNNRPL
jgi:hypothetical protein